MEDVLKFRGSKRPAFVRGQSTHRELGSKPSMTVGSFTTAVGKFKRSYQNPNIPKTLSLGAAASAWRLIDLMLFGLEFDELLDLKKWFENIFIITDEN